MKFFNVLNRKKEDFRSIEKDKIKMYACGITVSDNAHFGHAYQSIIFDMIKKYLEYKGYNVNYVRNYTDIDDKIIAKANELNTDPLEYAQKLIIKTDKELDILGSDRPTTMAKATDSIPDIINFIKHLIEKGYAYSAENGNVYFKVSAFKDYGKLSNIKVNENEVAVRKELEPGKKEDVDFALWKTAKKNEPFWESPWGKGRPGWHIECSAMVKKYLGDEIDIHGGGRDLIFPHHENEIAQSEALSGKNFANYWIHNGLIKINGQKMSKSLGNGIILEDLLKEYYPDVIRFAVLKTVYSSDINIDKNFFKEAEKQLYKMYSIFLKTSKIEQQNIDIEKTKEYISELKNEFEKAMDDDFNTSITTALLFNNMDFLSKEIEKKSSIYDICLIKDSIINLYKIFNILQSEPEVFIQLIKEKYLLKNEITKEYIKEKIEERAISKSNNNFFLADSIRKSLEIKGILLKDGKDKTEWDIEL